jgi:hypothetical protein
VLLDDLKGNVIIAEDRCEEVEIGRVDGGVSQAVPQFVQLTLADRELGHSATIP